MKNIIFLLLMMIIISCNNTSEFIEKYEEINKSMWLSQVLLTEDIDKNSLCTKYFNHVLNFGLLANEVYIEERLNSSYLKEKIFEKRESQKKYVNKLIEMEVIKNISTHKTYNEKYQKINKIDSSNVKEIISKEQMTDLYVNNLIVEELLQNRLIITDFNVFVSKDNYKNDTSKIKIRLEGTSNKTSPMLTINGKRQKQKDFWGYELYLPKKEILNGVEVILSYNHNGKLINDTIQIDE